MDEKIVNAHPLSFNLSYFDNWTAFIFSFFFFNIEGLIFGFMACLHTFCWLSVRSLCKITP